MYLVQYHGEIQEEDSVVTSEVSYDFDTKPSYSMGKNQPVKKPLEWMNIFQSLKIMILMMPY